MRRLASVRLFGVLAADIAAVSGVGAFLPQNAPSDWYHSAWPHAAGFILAAGLDQVYASWWFAGLLAALALNLAVCIWRRRRAVRWPSLAMHAGILLVLAGACLRVAGGAKGQLPLDQGQACGQLVASAAGGAVPRLPFQVRLSGFRIEYDAPDRHLLQVSRDGVSEEIEVALGRESVLPRFGLVLRPLRALGDFVMSADGQARERSAAASNPALQLELGWEGRSARHWYFDRFPDMQYDAFPFNIVYRHVGRHIKDFVSEVEFLAASGSAVRARVSVNAPARFQGWTFYQSGYEPGREDHSVLLAVRDPGVYLVFCGFAAVLLGMTAWLVRP
ncbi:MAG: cytochrome c biogenesis protein ResB [Elusimicrobiota bacterium]|jgi:cytochrome c biogenesis protein ResB